MPKVLLKVSLIALFCAVMACKAFSQRVERLPRIPEIVATAAKLGGFRAIHVAVFDNVVKQNVRLFTDRDECNVYLPRIEGCSVMFIPLDVDTDF
jgi:hypothetical protein